MGNGVGDHQGRGGAMKRGRVNVGISTVGVVNRMLSAGKRTSQLGFDFRDLRKKNKTACKYFFGRDVRDSRGARCSHKVTVQIIISTGPTLLTIPLQAEQTEVSLDSLLFVIYITFELLQGWTLMQNLLAPNTWIPLAEIAR